MKAFVVLYCLEGFGDQYSNILTGYKACQDLIGYGYQVEIIWVNRNLYFSSDLPLDLIYDFSSFDHFNVNISYVKTEKELPKNLKLVNSNQSAIKILVNFLIRDLINYDLPVYDIFGFYRNSVTNYDEKKLPNFNNQFLCQDIIQMSEKITENQNLKAIHIRTTDKLNNSSFDEILEDEFFREKIEKSFDFIEKNTENDIFIFSSNRNIKDYYHKNFSNVKFKDFSVELPLHHSYNRKIDEQKNILHSKEILSEMYLISKCEKIFTIGRNLSNFLTYGVCHNVHHKDWKNKFKNLIEN